jgi:hypothetical protein
VVGSREIELVKVDQWRMLVKVDYRCMVVNLDWYTWGVTTRSSSRLAERVADHVDIRMPV